MTTAWALWDAIDERAWARARSEAANIQAAVQRAKEAAVAESNESLANSLFLWESYAKAIERYGLAWETYGSGSYLSAWDDLVTAEECLEFLLRFLPLNEGWGVNLLHNRVELIERLYPYRVFSSIEYNAGRLECTICGDDAMGPACPHVHGKLYMGTMAGWIIRDMTALGVSLTPNPLDKRCVLTAVDGETIGEASAAGVQRLASSVKTPFHEFTVDETPRKVSPRQYRHLGRDAACPCRSGAKFGGCHWGTHSMRIPWTHIGIDPTWRVGTIQTHLPLMAKGARRHPHAK